MLKVQYSVTIHRPVEEVYEYIASHENHPDWQANLITSEKTGDQTIREVRKFLGRRIETTHEVTHQEKNTTICHDGRLEQPDRSSAFNRVYTFESVDGGTLLTHRLEMDSPALLRTGQPVFIRVLHREIQTDLERLRDLLEAPRDVQQSLATLPKHR